MQEQELRRLLADMTLEEKVNQMLQVTGGFFTGETVVTGPMREGGFSEENIALAGSVIGSMGAEKVKKIQKAYMERHPHHIPLLFMLDVINGLRTIFPIALGQAASFEPELVKRCAGAAAKESAVSGVHVTFSPMTDLVRDARWGRVMESTGEDPYLNALYADAAVRGYQGEHLEEPYRVAACVKHFAGYGAPVAGRDYNTVELSRHTLRAFHFPAYQAGIDAGAALVMTAFHTIDGIPATGNRWLMKDVLREEMGFDGVLISDWTAIEEMICHGYCADEKEAAVKSIQAGVDIDMMSGIYSSQLCQMVKNKELPEAVIDESVYRILELKNKLGLFENPYKDADEELEKQVILCREHRDLAREAARKSFVLLKNQQALPLNPKKRTAFIGPYVHSRNLMGSWSIMGRSQDVVTLREALEETKKMEHAVFCSGCPMLGEDVRLEGFTQKEEINVSPQERERMLREAVDCAKEAETVVLALGEHFLESGEATSKGEIQIPQIQMELFRRVRQVNDQIIVVLFSGRPLDIRELSEGAKAVLQVWMPGTEGARAIAEVLLGVYSPTGKLPMSFPYSVGQVPVFYNEYATGRPHVPGKDKDRFRSKYLDIPNKPLYPFGFGLTYTTFSLSLVELDKEELSGEQELEASLVIKNTGTLPGTETVQLYIRDVAASVVRPVKELKDFCKVSLQPGEERRIYFHITREHLRFLNQEGRWECEEGEFRVFVGTDSATENSKTFWFRG